MASEPTVDVASNDDDSPHRGPEDQSEGEVTDSEGEPADPTATGLSTLEQLKMSEEEQREYDAFSLASVSVPTSAKAQSIKSTHSDQRSVQLHSDQRQVQLRAPQDQANFPVLAPQGQGHRQGLGHPVVESLDCVRFY